MKMKLSADISFARASSMVLSGPYVRELGVIFGASLWIFSYVRMKFGWIMFELEPFWWLLVTCS